MKLRPITNAHEVMHQSELEPNAYVSEAQGRKERACKSRLLLTSLFIDCGPSLANHRTKKTKFKFWNSNLKLPYHHFLIQSIGVTLRWHVPLNHQRKQETISKVAPHHSASTLLATGTNTGGTISTGTISTPKKRTTLVTMATLSPLKKGVLRWACILEK